jgi:hypothetical protein
MELVGIDRADDDNLRLESKPTQEAGVAHSGNKVGLSKETTSNPKSQHPPNLQGVQLIVLLSCLFLGNFTIGFVGILAVQNELH